MPARARTIERAEDFSLHVGILASLLMHVVFIAILLTMPQRNTFQPSQVIDVSIEPPLPSKKVEEREEVKRQMVSPSEQTQKELPPIETNRESDFDSRVVKEQIRRGTENASPIVGSKPVKEQAPSKKADAGKERTTRSEKPRGQKKDVSEKNFGVTETDERGVLASGVVEAKPRENKKIDLKLDPTTLLNDFSPGKNGAKAPSQNKPFSRPQGSGAMFVGLNGSSDFLPNLPDGDITLLNAKANQFAVFVRRVAIQVFSQIRVLGWEDLSAVDIKNIGQDTMIEAVMSTKGELLGVKLLNSSSSRPFDELIVKAAKIGTKDPNPPDGAKASDGNVHFIFKSRSWSELVAGRGGIPGERRWLVLETGLE